MKCNIFVIAFKKKVDALAKEKDCELVGKWKEHGEPSLLVSCVNPQWKW